MKKFFYVITLCAITLLFAACEEEKNIAQEMTGRYSYTEYGTISLAGETSEFEDEGTFTISLSGESNLVFTGDFNGTGYVYTYGNKVYIDDQEYSYEANGIYYHFKDSFSDVEWFGNSISAKRTSAITAIYNNVTYTGLITSQIFAEKQ